MRLLLLLVGLLVLAAPAQAGTLERLGGDSPASYAFTAAPGERNELTVEGLADGFRVSDGAGRPAIAATRFPAVCVEDGAAALVCKGEKYLHINAGDGDDTVTVIGAAGASMDGGPGDDRLQGGPLNDSFTGGPGHDHMIGQGGDDRVVDGDGEADVYDAGLGVDSVSYRAAAAPVRVDLALGAGPDGDVLTGIDNVDGTDGPDVLLGDSGWNQLHGWGGEDLLDGREEHDILDGGKGRDVLEGGEGDDDLRDGADGDRLSGGMGDDRFGLPRRSSAHVHCGPGKDYIVEANLPWISPDCERIIGFGPIVVFRGARMSLHWDTLNLPRACRMRVTIGERSVVLRRHTGISFPITRPVRVRLKPSWRCRGPIGHGLPYVTAFRLTS